MWNLLVGSLGSEITEDLLESILKVIKGERMRWVKQLLVHALPFSTSSSLPRTDAHTCLHATNVRYSCRREQEDMVELLQRELGSEYPTLMWPLLHERNAAMALALVEARACGAKRVVAVVGKGHLPGLVHSLMQQE